MIMRYAMKHASQVGAVPDPVSHLMCSSSRNVASIHAFHVLLQGGFAENLKLLQRYPSVDVQTILVQAAQLR